MKKREPHSPSKSKLLFVDIETSPLLSWTWGRWEQDVVDVEREWYILCFSAKWLNGRTFVRALPDYSLYKKDKENDRELVHHLHQLLDEAEIVVAHNGDRFDLRKVNARFSFHGLPPPRPYKTIDTLKVAKKYFGFSSNKLHDLGVHLGMGGKVETGGFKLWKGCMTGDKKSWARMKLYNGRDVDLLYKVYKRFLPWVTTHPKLGRYFGLFCCDHCGNRNFQSRGFAYTKTKRWRQLQCNRCWSWKNVLIKKGEVV